MANEISVSMHAGSGKNAIENLDKIKRCDLHNNRKYKNNRNEEIDLSKSKYNITLKGTKNITDDIKKFYKEEFGEAVHKYNEKQKDERRKIVDYLEKVNKERNNIAVEFILQIGDKQDWQDVSMEDKVKTKDIFEKAIGILEKRGIKTVNASLHLDETSPHLHLIAVPVVENQKRGLEKQVSQRQILTLKTLYEVRKEVEETFLQEYNKIYGTSKELKRGSEIEEHLTVENYKDTKKVLEVAKKYGDKKELKRQLEIDLSELDKDIKKVKNEIEAKKEEQSKMTKLELELDAVIKEKERIKSEKIKTKEKIEEEQKIVDKEIIELQKQLDSDEELSFMMYAELQEKNKDLKEKIENLKNEINSKEELEKQLKSNNNEVFRLKEDIEKSNEKILEYQTRINNINSELEAKKKEQEKSEKELKELNEEKIKNANEETQKVIENRRRIEADLEIKKKEEKEYQDKLDKTKEKIKELEKANNIENEKLQEMMKNKTPAFNIQSDYKDFLEEIIEKKVTKFGIFTSWNYGNFEDISLKYLDKDDKLVNLKNELPFNANHYVKGLEITESIDDRENIIEKNYIYNLKNEENYLELGNDSNKYFFINFKPASVFEILKTLNANNIEDILENKIKSAMGIEKEDEEIKIENTIKFTDYEIKDKEKDF